MPVHGETRSKYLINTPNSIVDAPGNSGGKMVIIALSHHTLILSKCQEQVNLCAAVKLTVNAICVLTQFLQLRIPAKFGNYCQISI